jgi:hypothetical protein
MPFWYFAALAMLAVGAVATRTAVSIAATATMASAVVVSVTILVPINTRVGRWRVDTDVDRSLTRRWDVFHWVRVGLLAVTFTLLAMSGK